MAVLWDVVVVGGGPAGLSAALMLGRCRHRVVVCDDGKPRNRSVPFSHGFFSRDGVAPSALRAIGRAQLKPYGIPVVPVRALSVHRRGEHFKVTLATGRELFGKTLLLATGLHDPLPAVPGAVALYGKSLFHCPYCHGFEHRDQRLCVYGASEDAVTLALGLLAWSTDVVLLTHGHPVTRGARKRLQANGVKLELRRLARLVGVRGQLKKAVFTDGDSLVRDAMFFHAQPTQASPLAQRLGCRLTRHGTVEVDRHMQTTEPGVYAAGDTTPDAQFIAVAVAEGVKAAMSIHKALQHAKMKRIN